MSTTPYGPVTHLSPPPPAPPRRGARGWLVVGVAAVVLLLVVSLVTALVRQEDVRDEAAFPGPGEPYAETLDRTEEDLNAFWRDALPEAYDVRYEDLRHGMFPYTSQDPPADCGLQTFTYDEMRNNAYYCPPQPAPRDRSDVASGDYVTYDDEALMPRLSDTFGSVGVAVVLAHEWGHAIQSRALVVGKSIELELQADCFAGAWMGHLRDGGSPTLVLGEGDLTTAAAALLTFRDPPGSDPEGEVAHGSGFDRVSAFTDGVENGVGACTGYTDGTLEYTETTYTTLGELVSGGQAAVADLVPVVVAGLRDFWPTAFGEAFGRGPTYSPVATVLEFRGTPPDCAGGAVPQPEEAWDLALYCPDSDTEAWSVTAAEAAVEDFGDGAVAQVLADRWGFGMRSKAGEGLDSVADGLTVDCTTGAWFGWIYRGGSPDVQLSPGDLDEAVASLLVSELLADFQEERGSGFDRVTQFRAGFDDGVGGCEAA